MNTEERAIREALYKLLKIGANMLTNGISAEIDEWDLPKTTPISAKRKIIREACRWNDLNRRRAIELKGVYDILSKQLSAKSEVQAFAENVKEFSKNSSNSDGQDQLVRRIENYIDNLLKEQQ